jgi:hypothetical protein
MYRQALGDLARRAAGIPLDLADGLNSAADALGEGFLREVERFAAQFEPGPERKLLWHISLLPYQLVGRVCPS